MASPVVPADFSSCIPNANSTLCGTFVSALLKLTVLIARFIAWMLDTDGTFTDAFKKMLSDASVKTGMIVPSAGDLGTTDEYLLCDGTVVSRTTYADLFAVIGEAWGAGDGSTTFKLPDLQAKFLVGAGTLGATTVSVGTAGGSLEVTLTEAQLPAHTHYVSVESGESGMTVASEVGRFGGTSLGWNTSDSSTKAGRTREDGPNTPGTQAVVTLPAPPFAGVRYYIKT